MGVMNLEGFRIINNEDDPEFSGDGDNIIADDGRRYWVEDVALMVEGGKGDVSGLSQGVR